MRASLRAALRAVGVVEFGADCLGVGVAEVGEDGQGLLVGIAGGMGVAGGVVGVAETGQGGGFVVHGVEFVVQRDGALVVRGGLPVLIEVVVSERETVQCVGLTLAVVLLLEQLQGLFAGGDGVFVRSNLDLIPADRVQGTSVTAVTGGPVQVARLLGVAECAFGPALLTQDGGEAAMDVGLTGQVFGLLI